MSHSLPFESFVSGEAIDLRDAHVADSERERERGGEMNSCTGKQ